MVSSYSLPLLLFYSDSPPLPVCDVTSCSCCTREEIQEVCSMSDPITMLKECMLSNMASVEEIKVHTHTQVAQVLSLLPPYRR